jgi:tetratricopeptide (TPR) repeat protein
MQLTGMAVELQCRGELEAAARLWEQVVVKTGQHACPLVALGDLLYDLGQKDKALEKHQAAVKKDGRCGIAWVSLTRHYLERRDFAAGLEPAEQAITHAADDPTAWANRAGILFGLGRFAEGLESARHATELDDRNPWGLYYLGACARELGRTEEARGALERLVLTSGHPDLVESAKNILARL